MTALELAAKAGAGPVAWLEPVTITDDDVRAFTRVSRQGDETYMDLIVDIAEASGIADIIRRGETIRSLDYVSAPVWTPLDPRR